MSLTTRLAILLLAVGSAAVCGPAAVAKDAYYDIPSSQLKLVDCNWPEAKTDAHRYDWRQSSRLGAMIPYAVVDGPGEVYLTGPGMTGYYGEIRSESNRGVDHLLLRAPEGKEVRGRLFVRNAGDTGMTVLKFVVPASGSKAEAKQPFLNAKLAHYNRLLGPDIPGGAWYRHQIRLTRNELKLPPDGPQADRPRVVFNARDELTTTYDLFTGGRAISENLQLDRAMPQRGANETPVKVDSITGITISEIDWKPLIKDAQPALDPLASKLPSDQHVVFFPSFQAALAVSDETKQHDTPVLRLAEPRSEDARVVERYQRQFGLPLSTLARLLGPTVVKTVALTGSDPSFPLGTDAAVLFETDQPALLSRILLGRIAMAGAEVKNAKPSQGTIDGLRYQGFVSPGRVVSSYVAQLDGAVVVANSTYQLQRLAAVRNGKTPSLASLPEYKFFRIRYPRTDADESAFIFLSDATIRRWCGPRWRIGESRRTRARAVLAELQASQMEGLVRRKVEPGVIHTDLPILGDGKLELTPGGVTSSEYGTLDYMTPIAELTLDEVTKTEADAYSLWRDGYQRNWSWGFDPIGVRISLGKQKLAADLTIMPLIMNTEYRRFAEISLGGKFGPLAGDPHRALVHFIMALNRESEVFKFGESIASNMGHAISLGWVGPSLSVYADEDPFWQDLAKVKEEDLEKFTTQNIGRLPVAVRIDSSNPLKLAAFLTTARTYIEQTAPGLTRWEPMKYKETPYVRISPLKGQGVPQDFEKLAIYYTSVGGSLTVTLSEKVMQHAIDRTLARQAAAEDKPAKEPAATQLPWLGTTVGLHVDSQILEIAKILGHEQYQQQMQVRSWSNLPILNVWKRLYPDRDPVAVHRQIWGVELVCPGGGKYVWNEEYQTMESTVYGHPGQPKDGPAAPPILSSFTTADFGLTLENQGLRSRVELRRAGK